MEQNTNTSNTYNTNHKLLNEYTSYDIDYLKFQINKNFSILDNNILKLRSIAKL